MHRFETFERAGRPKRMIRRRFETASNAFLRTPPRLLDPALFLTMRSLEANCCRQCSDVSIVNVNFEEKHQDHVSICHPAALARRRLPARAKGPDAGGEVRRAARCRGFRAPRSV